MEINKKKVFEELKALIAVVLCTFLFGIGVKWFFEAAEEPLYSIGVPGISQLIRNAIIAFTGKDLGDVFLGALVLIINIPVILLGWFGVSKRFTIYSLISVLIQATLLGFIPKVDLGIEDTFTLAIMGGFLAGIGAGGALRFGTSTGGLDIVAQYFSFKKGISVGYFSLILNVSIALLGGLIGGSWAITAYTIISIIVTTVTIDKIHTSYNFLKVQIITTIPDIVYARILEDIYRGGTLLPAQGAYSKNDKSILMIVISAYELIPIKKLIYESDPSAFVIVEPVRHVYGNFKRKTIV